MSETREVWSGRTVFILAAVGSAVGLGNIWRFPYVAYKNGGGAFIIPYLIALITAGLTMLFLDYAIGHRFRGSAPLAFRRMSRPTEFIGWWQTGICFVISIYYAVIIAWSLRYVGFAVNHRWGDDPEGFFAKTFLQQDSEAHLGFHFVPGVLIPLIVIWVATIAVLALGVQRGIGASSAVFIPVLVTLFVVFVVRALFLDGATDGLNALFKPNWSALTDSGVWIAAYGQIFFSLSVGFGIMLTYASYLKKRTDLTGSGLVVGFANSGFEILAGIGVFAALGFMAHASGVAVDKVVSGGIGLAFIAFPTIISQMPGGSFLGVLFFISLLLAGFTSLISLVQVVVAAVQEKAGINRVPSVLLVGGVMTIASVALFPTTTGLNTLDIVDNFANNVGIVSVALVTLIVVVWLLGELPALQAHLNAVSSFKVGPIWRFFVGVLTPIVLAWMLIDQIVDRVNNGYESLPTTMVVGLGWGLQAAVIIISIALSLAPWPPKVDVTTGQDSVLAPAKGASR